MITDKPDDPNGDGLADFTWTTDAGVAYYRCMIENEGFLPCSSPYLKILNISNSGQHQFAVRAYDTAGNFSETSYTWKVDIAMRFTIVGNATGLLYPGAPATTIDLVLHNPNNFPISVDELYMELENKSACPPANFVPTQPGTGGTMSPTVTVPSNGSIHVPFAQRPTLRLLNTASNQDACKNLTFTLTYAGHAIK